MLSREKVGEGKRPKTVAGSEKKKQKRLSTTNFLFTKHTVFSKNLMANQVPSSAQVYLRFHGSRLNLSLACEKE